ncbi:MAG: HD domain-containing protein, partial [Deltaproteobacteria bacterium]|nr:HD domain-containing protein [Deltaproteobacteria bacterium]
VFKPLSILKTTVKKFAEGRLKERVWIPRKDEIGELAHAFNSMAEDLSKMHEGLEKLVDERTNDVVETRNATIFGLAHLAEYKDKETYRHLERMSEYAVVIAKELRKDSEYFSYIDERYIDNLFISAPLHDIGKVGIPDVILLKPGKLTPEEFEIMKQHTTLGGDLLKNMQTKLTKKNFLEMGKHVAYGHHERVDGKGYPRGLKTEETPVSARIVALADVYDALRSRRSYKEPFSHAKAVEIIRAGTGMQFDEKIVHAFLKCEDGILEVAARLGEEYS